MVWILIPFFFIIIVGARFLIPLIIPRYPLPGVLACLILDSADQTLFQRFTTINLEGYQGYDKALDIYYLTITYISTLANWRNAFAFKTSRFLYYYRLVGVTLFELTHIRAILMIFPNTFEYFFIFYEAVRTRWNPLRLTKKAILLATALIWIFIKLPQEYWIHIAQIDTTEFLNEKLFGMPKDTPIGQSLTANPEITLGIILAIVSLLLIFRWILKNKLPAPDWNFKIKADKVNLLPERAKNETGHPLLEKVFMIGLVGVIFAQVLPGIELTNLQLFVVLGAIVALNGPLGSWLARKYELGRSLLKQFVVTVFINTVLGLLFVNIIPRFEGKAELGNMIFFSLLLTFLAIMFDRFNRVHQTSEPILK